MPKLEPHDVSSMTVLRNKVSYELNSREDFDQKSKDEVIRIFELYQYKYITMGVYYSKVAPRSAGLPFPRDRRRRRQREDKVPCGHPEWSRRREASPAGRGKTRQS